MIEALQLEFMRNALAAGILVSVVCGVIGTLVVVNRIVGNPALHKPGGAVREVMLTIGCPQI